MLERVHGAVVQRRLVEERHVPDGEVDCPERQRDQWVSEVQGERGETISYLWGPGSSIGLRQAQSESEGPYDRYRVGLHHVALEATSRAVVNERADWLRAQGMEIESGPEEYWYIPGYYAVFFYDPDGLKLEIVHVPGQAA